LHSSTETGSPSYQSTCRETATPKLFPEVKRSSPADESTQSRKMEPLNFLRHNRTAWNRLAENQDRLTKPAREVDFLDPLKSVDAPGWLGPDIRGRDVLCLAAGGGRQGPLYAAAGANVIVVDFSPAMLELDKKLAREKGLSLRTIETNMEDLAVLGEATIDIVIHPVSTCYIPDVMPVYREVARVLRCGGLYISQHKQPTSLQSDLEMTEGCYSVRYPYYFPQPLPRVSTPNWIREDGTQEFVHRWEDLIGKMCRAGMVIEDLIEPLHAHADAQPNSFEHRAQYIAPYVRIKARRAARQAAQTAKLIFIS
jgi:ubiquinone/menaquinone biosynthesis C-methylase UbiE